MKIYLTEVSPRDGLQNFKENVDTERKVKFIDLLSETGVDEIEVSSFVHPKWVPQLSDAEEVFRRIKRKDGVIYSAIVPNEKGLERALKVKPDKISVLTAASETFNKKNINMSIKESLRKIKPLVESARSEGLKTRGYISTAFWCPYEGKIDPYRVKDIVVRLLEIGVDEVSLGDTIGRASPKDVDALLEILLKEISKDKVVLHFHATYGMGIANAICAFKEFEIYRFDSSAGGLGGCPYAPGASGNIPSEDLIFALKEMGAEVKANEHKILEAVISVKLPVNSNIGRVKYGRYNGFNSCG